MSTLTVGMRVCVRGNWAVIGSLNEGSCEISYLDDSSTESINPYKIEKSVRFPDDLVELEKMTGVEIDLLDASACWSDFPTEITAAISAGNILYSSYMWDGKMIGCYKTPFGGVIYRQLSQALRDTYTIT